MNSTEWTRVSEIFGAVYLDTPPEQREAELASQCSGDVALEIEVRRLILASERKGPLDEALDVFADVGPGEFNSAGFVPAQLIGGRFRLIRLLGQGGMGQVWEAFDEQLGVARALKTIRPEVAGDPVMIERFKREVERAQSVTHPGVCRVYDLSYEGDVPFLSMELLSGESLAERLRRGGVLGPKEAVLILRQCASALDSAHRAGLIHLDFKPANVMLVPDGETEVRAVVTDFGLALSADWNSLEFSTPGAGTPAYMSPEQAAGKGVGAAADIYAFGVVACRVLSGKRPGEGGLERLTRRQRTALLKCLDSEPSRRPKSCSVCVEELYGRPWTRRLWVAVVATAVAGAVARALGRGQTVPLPSIAILPWKPEPEVEETHALAESVADALQARLARVKKLRVVPRSSSSQYLAAKEGPGDFASRIHARFLLTGTLRASDGRVVLSAQLADASADRVLWAQTYDRPEADLPEIERSVADAALAQIGLGGLDQDMAEARRTPAADRAFRLGRYHLSRHDSASLKKARRYLQTSIDLEPAWAPPRVAMAQTLLAMAERQDEAPRSALPAAEEALNRAFESDPQAAEAQATFGLLASVYFHDFAMAEKSFQRAIDSEPNNATARQWYSYTLAKEGRFPEALRQSSLAIEMDPLSQPAYQNHAAVLFYAARYQELIAQADSLADLNPAHYWPPILRAYAYAQTGRRSDALRELEASVQSPNPPVMVLRMAGEIYSLLGDRAKALDLLQRLEQMRAVGDAVPASYIGFLLAALGQTEEAFRWLETAWTEGDSFLSVLFVYPACASLRSDPRFHRLVARLGVRESMVADSRRVR